MLGGGGGLVLATLLLVWGFELYVLLRAQPKCSLLVEMIPNIDSFVCSIVVIIMKLILFFIYSDWNFLKRTCERSLLSFIVHWFIRSLLPHLLMQSCPPSKTPSRTLLGFDNRDWSAEFCLSTRKKKKTLSANGIARQIKKVLAPRMSVISLHITGTSIFLMPSNLTIFQTMREPLMHGLCILSWTNLYDFPVYMLPVSFTSKPSAFSYFAP